MSVSLSEAKVRWREFLSSLQRRGPGSLWVGVQLIVSDNHAGLKVACAARVNRVRAPFWQGQRCQFHLCRMPSIW